MASVGFLVKGKARTAGHVYSFKCTDALENGMIVFKGDLVSGEKEVYTAVKPTTAALGTSTAKFIQAPEVNYDESTYNTYKFSSFSIPANTECRGYDLYEGDLIEVSYDGLTLLATDAVVGNYLIPANNSYKLAESATIGSTKFAAKIVEVKTVGTLTYVGGNGQVGNQYKMVVAEIVKV